MVTVKYELKWSPISQHSLGYRWNLENVLLSSNRTKSKILWIAGQIKNDLTLEDERDQVRNSEYFDGENVDISIFLIEFNIFLLKIEQFRKKLVSISHAKSQYILNVHETYVLSAAISIYLNSCVLLR